MPNVTDTSGHEVREVKLTKDASDEGIGGVKIVVDLNIGDTPGGSTEARVAVNCVNDDTSVFHPKNEEDKREDGEEELSSDEEQDEEILDNPSKNIKRDLRAALDEGFDFEGSFAWGDSFPQAPNPCLHVSTLGPIGLPLSSREARHLIATCIQAPFGKTSETIVDKSVRDTWELNPDKFKFLNPEWDRWIQGTVAPTASLALGVPKSKKVPRAELYKLLLYEMGSHFLPHQDTEKSPGMFATIVVVLPSKYEGATVHLSHSGRTKVFDFAKSSATTTSALAWYTDVYHAVYPVLFGYRLALSYNLIHPSSAPSPRPTLPKMNAAIERLRHVLLSWKQNTEKNTPKKLAYQLKHQYSLVGLQDGHLKGSDAHLISCARGVADELNLSIRLANVELYQSGYSGDDGYHRKRGRWGDSESSEEDAYMEEVEEEIFSVQSVVDLDGRRISVKPDFGIDQENEIITGRISGGDPDQKEVEGYQGNYGGAIQYWYRKTFLLIWRKSEELAVTGQDILGHTCEKLKERLEATLGSHPRRTDRRHFEMLIEACAGRDPAKNRKDLDRALPLLVESAFRWKDCDMWIRSVKVCGVVVNIGVIDSEGFAAAWKAFGFLGLRNFLEEVFHDAQPNYERFETIVGLALIAKEQKDIDAQTWCENQHESILRSLGPIVAADIPILVNIVKARGAGLIQDVILPQIEKNLPHMTVQLSLILELYAAEAWIPPSPAIASDSITRLISALITNIPILPPTAVLESREHRLWALRNQVQPGVTRAPPESSHLIIDLCMRTGNVDALKLLFCRLRDAFQQVPDPQKLLQVTYHLIPIAERLEVFFSKDASLKAEQEPWSVFYSMAVDIIRCTVMSETALANIPKLTAAIRRAGVPILNEKLRPIMLTLAQKNVETVKAITLAFFGERSYLLKNASTEDEASFSEFMTFLVVTTIAHTDLRNTTLPQHLSSRQPSSIALELIKFCTIFASSAPQSLWQRVLRRLYPTSGMKKPQYYTQYLQPFILGLHAYAAPLNFDLTSEPIREFAATCVLFFVRDVLGPKPPEKVTKDQISGIGCGCADCGSVREFLLGPHKVITIPRAKGIRTHLERGLLASAYSFGVNWITITKGSPQQLQIAKPDHMVAPGRWRQNRAVGVAFLQSLGSDEVQQRILLSDYAAVTTALEIRTSPSTVEGSAPSTASLSTTLSPSSATPQSRLSDALPSGGAQLAAPKGNLSKGSTGILPDGFPPNALHPLARVPKALQPKPLVSALSPKTEPPNPHPTQPLQLNASGSTLAATVSVPVASGSKRVASSNEADVRQAKKPKKVAAADIEVIDISSD